VVNVCRARAKGFGNLRRLFCVFSAQRRKPTIAILQGVSILRLAELKVFIALCSSAPSACPLRVFRSTLRSCQACGFFAENICEFAAVMCGGLTTLNRRGFAGLLVLASPQRWSTALLTIAVIVSDPM
jgi:hypothetical protein